MDMHLNFTLKRVIHFTILAIKFFNSSTKYVVLSCICCTVGIMPFTAILIQRYLSVLWLEPGKQFVT